MLYSFDNITKKLLSLKIFVLTFHEQLNFLSYLHNKEIQPTFSPNSPLFPIFFLPTSNKNISIMLLSTILKDTNYKLTQFSFDKIKEMEDSIVLKTYKDNQFPVVNCLASKQGDKAYS